jgi:hypothetical protein
MAPMLDRDRPPWRSAVSYRCAVDPERLGQLTRVLQLSITPVALISGVGLLLLSVTNRLGRVIDRARELAREARPADLEPAHEERRAEIRLLFRRARYLLLSIFLIAFATFVAVLMVVALFGMYLSGADLGAAVLVLFGACLLLLVASIAFFLGDILLSIRWLRLSLRDHL